MQLLNDVGFKSYGKYIHSLYITFQNNTKIAINMHLLEIFALLLVFSNQFTAKCLSLPPPLLGSAISKPLTLPFALAFWTSNIETVV